MKQKQIEEIQRKIGVDDDGFFGPKSVAALKKHLTKLYPNPHPFPKSKDIEKFYGEPGEHNLVSINVEGLGVVYLGSPVKKIRCHKLVADSLLRIIKKLSESECKWILEKYVGVYEKRNMRNGTKLSTHCWGIAIDLDSLNNKNLWHWPDKATMPLEVMEIFASEGWLSAAAFWGRDAMHFQATSD